MNQNKVLSVRNLVLIAMFSALAAVLETIQVAVPFAPPFKNLLKLLLNGTSTYYVGELGNIIGSCMFSVPAALIYRRHKTKKTAMVALAAGVICAIVGAVFVNCAITLPFYAKVAFGGIENIIAMGTKINPAVTNLYTFAIFMIVPFNLVKCGLNAIVTALVYKHVSVIIHAGVHREKKTENTAA